MPIQYDQNKRQPLVLGLLAFVQKIVWFSSKALGFVVVLPPLFWFEIAIPLAQYERPKEM